MDVKVDIPTRVLVESMIREDATIDAAELYAVANALGMTDQQVRLHIRRLVAEGQLVQEGRGRRASLRVDAEIRGAIEPNVEFIRFMYDQDRGAAPWDGNWHLVAFAIPEVERQARDAMRDGIVHLGGAAIQGGLYVSPNPWEPYIEALAGKLGVGGYMTRLTTTNLLVGELDSPREIAARLWPLEEIAARHDRLLDVARARLDRLAGPRELSQPEILTVAIELAAEFTRATDPDPLLPPELVPQPWPGAHARAVVAECWAQLMSGQSLRDRLRIFRLYAEVIGDVVEDAGRAPGGAQP
ncbi:DNA-binding transcriptional regulator [Nocardia lijiangensis]|uniref:DNA-binding transcriptional regulator n=1 Tax=Nocardia lijiangensis TaxID=299618 RepID=UPI00082B59F5|nr:DNA-binding transcriptional regulator [Nocardia lijiangensis]